MNKTTLKTLSKNKINSSNTDFIDHLYNEIDNDSRDLLRDLYYLDDNAKNIDYDQITKDSIIDFINDIQYQLDNDLEYIYNFDNPTLDKIKMADYIDLDPIDLVNIDSYYDLSHEQADSYVDIYNYDLHKKALYFRFYTEDAISEFWSEEKDIIKIYQLGQYYFYNHFFNQIINWIESYLNDLNNNN